jgi:hypothetical protein
MNGRIKVIDSELVIAHVLVDETTCDIHILIFWHLHKHAAQTLEGLVETIQSVIEETQMESAAYEVFRD